jgi:hypothetical protein
LSSTPPSIIEPTIKELQMSGEQQHPTQSVAPGAEPEQPGPGPEARLVDPEEAILAEFLPPAHNAGATDVPAPPAHSSTEHA